MRLAPQKYKASSQPEYEYSRRGAGCLGSRKRGLAPGDEAMRRCTLRVLLFLALPVLVQTATPAPPPLRIKLDGPGFEEIARANGVTVYKHKRTDVIRVGAEGTIRASPSRVQRAILSYDKQAGRLARLSESRVIRRSRHELLVYQRLNLPVIDDRDFTLQVRWGRTGGKRWVAYRAVRSETAPPSGVVRVSTHRGVWEIVPIMGGKGSHVRYEFTIDLAGRVPMWMARAGAGRELPDLFATIRKLACEGPEETPCHQKAS